MESELKGRQLKKEVKKLLASDDLNGSILVICRYPARQIVNYLFSCFYSKEEKIRWHAIMAMGKVVSKLAEENIDSARIIMRRLMWNLNDESGGIGWGSPEAMGEIMANHERLSDEFASILRSYLREDENFLEYEALQRGVLWGVGRLAQVYPEKLKNIEKDILPFLGSSDAILRGYAAWALENVGSTTAVNLLEHLTGDHEVIPFFDTMELTKYPVSKFVVEALENITQK